MTAVSYSPTPSMVTIAAWSENEARTAGIAAGAGFDSYSAISAWRVGKDSPT
jgi:hypothetical protein